MEMYGCATRNGNRSTGMTKIGSTFIVGLLLAAIVPATALAGSGGPPTAASGTWDDCNIDPSVRVAGPNLIVTVGIDQSYHGTLEGSYIATERDVVYADGGATFTGRGTFEGSVAGLEGTGRLHYRGAVGPSFVMPATGPHSGTWVLVGETGELAGVTARGNWGAQFVGYDDDCPGGRFGGTYSGQVITH
jgi:hypothetical protein